MSDGRRFNTFRLLGITSFLLIFAISLLVLASERKQIPTARKVWSVAVHIGTGQPAGTELELNSGSLLTFAGNRVVAVGLNFGDYGEGKAVSRYQVISLDQNSGLIKNQLEFAGPWGAVPEVFGIGCGKFAMVGSHVVRIFNSDLSKTAVQFLYNGNIEKVSPDGTTLALKTGTDITLLTSEMLKPRLKLSVTSDSALVTSISPTAVLDIDLLCRASGCNGAIHGNLFPKTSINLIDGNGEHLLFQDVCGAPGHFLTKDRILISGCGKIYILDNNGKVLKETRYSTPGGLFAGVSQNGRRFALEFSDERGDPSVLLYQRFVIYDSTAAAPVASISITPPEWQSWSAFSPDGRYFAVGNPDKLTLYVVP